MYSAYIFWLFSCCREPLELVLDPHELPDAACEVLACCQSLVMIDGELIGDPLEKAALQVRGFVSIAKWLYALVMKGWRGAG
jgi:hypothetical protein